MIKYLSHKQGNRNCYKLHRLDRLHKKVGGLCAHILYKNVLNPSIIRVLTTIPDSAAQNMFLGDCFKKKFKNKKSVFTDIKLSINNVL